MFTRIQRNSGGVQASPDPQHRLRQLVLSGMASLILAACASTGSVRESTTLRSVEPGVYVAPAAAPDTLLRLGDVPDLRVLVIQDEFERISDAHVVALRDWVSRGGTTWIAGPGLQNPTLRLLTPFQYQPFDFHKTSTGERGGELVVRDSVGRLQIHDDPLTEGVRELYVYPRWRFDGTSGLAPILEMTDKAGAQGTILGVVQLGAGRVILDGTARTPGGFFTKLPGFDSDHPNAVQQGDDWKSYDWDRLVANARELSEDAMNGDAQTSGS